MDIRTLSPAQIHDIDLATQGAFMALMHEKMIAGPYVDCDVSVDFLGRGYRIDLVFGRGRDGHLGSMTTFATMASNDLPEEVCLGLLVLQVECFQRRMADRLRRYERAASARAMPKHG